MLATGGYGPVGTCPIAFSRWNPIDTSFGRPTCVAHGKQEAEEVDDLVMSSHSLVAEFTQSWWSRLKEYWLRTVLQVLSPFGGSNVARLLDEVHCERALLNNVNFYENQGWCDDADKEAIDYEEHVEQSVQREVVVSLRVVRNVRTVLISKVGYLDLTKANELVVKKMALKIMQEAKFRKDCIRVNLPAICTSYFHCRQSEDRAGRARRRIPRWVLKALGLELAESKSD